MFAVRDRRSRKFLKTFSGSYNNFCWRTQYKLTVTRALPLQEGQTYPRYETVHNPSKQEIHDAMFCLDSPDGAKLYTGNAGILNSIGGGAERITDPVTGQHKGWRMIPMAIAKPWLEVVDVQTFERRRATARRAAATRKRNSRKAKPAKRRTKARS